MRNVRLLNYVWVLITYLRYTYTSISVPRYPRLTRGCSPQKVSSASRNLSLVQPCVFMTSLPFSYSLCLSLFLLHFYSSQILFLSRTFNLRTSTTIKMASNNSNDPSMISGHAQYAKGYAEETIGNVTGSKEWQDSGKKDTQAGIDEMKVLALTPNQLPRNGPQE